MINVLFFGKMADLLGCRTLRIEADGTYLFTVRDQVFETPLKDGRVSAADIRMSVNRKVVTTDVALEPGDEVAFFSVFSGG